ncbi:hypothetical protein [Dyadobacter sp. CY343]|uniref:hypothetical protein n=1 Tax=Dyadobacter sp. CY343 TaxID=2907299 RepID=UPI001F2A29C4|nr:hypothetical protein [Dyadobacter sp. CY343]MCE7060857.1 hypothetical protein [Dyadobacter sp. CY343]
MDALTYLRDGIRTYFSESTELQLGGKLATQRRFNFYFKINPAEPYLVYLNWDGEEDRFTLKCLEFSDPGQLNQLVAAYPETGSKVFNAGKPRSAVSFLYQGKSRLSRLHFNGVINEKIEAPEIDAPQLLRCVDPFYKTS